MSIKIEAGKYYLNLGGIRIGPMEEIIDSLESGWPSIGFFSRSHPSALWLKSGNPYSGFAEAIGKLVAEWSDLPATAIDISKIEVGDDIHLLCKVIGRTGNGSLLVDNGTRSYVPLLERIAAHIPAPRPIKIGDVVKVKWFDEIFAVVGLDGDDAWLRNSHARRITRTISELTRVDSPSAESAQ